jgi:hypothetical protein
VTKHKGPRFPSFDIPKPSKHKTKTQWKFHAGKQQRLRNLRRSCAEALKLSDEASLAILAKTRELVGAEVNAELVLLILVNSAWETHLSTGAPFAQALAYLNDKFEHAEPGDVVL